MTFEKSLERVEELLENLESGGLGLEDSLRCYEEGIKLIHSCQARLSEAEQRVYRLKEQKKEQKGQKPEERAENSVRTPEEMEDFERFSYENNS